jgi:3'(2'), 5'-bisphosphate nucleotidase
VHNTSVYLPYLEPLTQLCLRAGDAIAAFYHAPERLEATTKSDSTPLTAADLAAHEILVRGLAPLGLPVLSEESAALELCKRRDWRRYWLVDPLDGTREFLERTGEFTINIALVEDHKAVLGVIAVPLQGRIYLGGAGEGAWLREAGQWRALPARTVDSAGPLTVLTSRRHRGEQLDACLADVQRLGRAVQRCYVGSALKFCQLAAGEADFYPRFSPCSEWDTAAGQALLEGAGGAVIDLQGQALSYNRRESLLNPHFYAMADARAQWWREFLPVVS